MGLIGNVGAIYKVYESDKRVEPVGVFLEWELDDNNEIVARHFCYVSAEHKPPFHGVLFSGNLLYLGDNIGWFTENPPTAPDDDFREGLFKSVVGFLLNRVPPFTAAQWKKTVLEEGRLYDALMLATHARLKKGSDLLDMHKQVENRQEKIGGESI